MTFAERYGPWAVVAGASQGLGAEFAAQVAARGLDVALVARRAGPLEEVAERLRTRSGAAVRKIVADLRGRAGVEDVLRSLADAEVGLLIHNAAHAPAGRFLEMEVEEALGAIDVNVRSLVLLAHAFGRAMAVRRRGGIVVMSSLSGFQGAPYIAAYGATKAFEICLAEGLWYELRSSGVDVLAVAAGATATPGLAAGGARDAPGRLDPAAVAGAALDALGRGPLTVPGAFNRVAAQLLRRGLPVRSAVGLMGRQTERLL